MKLWRWTSHSSCVHRLLKYWQSDEWQWIAKYVTVRFVYIALQWFIPTTSIWQICKTVWWPLQFILMCTMACIATYALFCYMVHCIALWWTLRYMLRIIGTSSALLLAFCVAPLLHCEVKYNMCIMASKLPCTVLACVTPLLYSCRMYHSSALWSLYCIALYYVGLCDPM